MTDSQPAGRVRCWRCFLSSKTCYCPVQKPFDYPAHFGVLQHPREFRNAVGSGRMTHLGLRNSSLWRGASFDDNERLWKLIAAPDCFTTLLYPGDRAWNLSRPEDAVAMQEALNGRRLQVLVIDGTWASARKMLRISPRLAALPWISFDSSRRSEYRIRPQPDPLCLSTLEAVHELIEVLARSQVEPLPADRAHDNLMSTFRHMIDTQLRIARDPAVPGYRRGAYKDFTTTPAGKRKERTQFLYEPDQP
jgi:DTW domain-containing protein YfiP